MIHFATVNRGLGRPQHLGSSTTPSTFLTVNNLATWRNPHHTSFGEVERTFWSALWRETHRLQNDFRWCSEQFLLLPFHILDLTKRPFFVLGVACFDISMQLLFSHKAQNIESSFGCPEEAPDFGSRGLYWKADVPPGIPLGLFSLNDKVVVFPHASIWIKNIFNIWDESFGCFEKKYPGFNCTYVCPPAKSQVAKRFWQKMVNFQFKSAVAFQGASQKIQFSCDPLPKKYITPWTYRSTSLPNTCHLLLQLLCTWKGIFRSCTGLLGGLLSSSLAWLTTNGIKHPMHIGPRFVVQTSRHSCRKKRGSFHVVFPWFHDCVCQKWWCFLSPCLSNDFPTSPWK